MSFYIPQSMSYHVHLHQRLSLTCYCFNERATSNRFPLKFTCVSDKDTLAGLRYEMNNYTSLSNMPTDIQYSAIFRL